jgi:hypothetical protein
VFAYRIEDGKKSERIGTDIEASDELAFAYVNPGGLERLLIFGVDEHGHVYWYQPTWTSAADNPRSVLVDSGPEVHELPNSVAHTLDGKQLTIHYIFTNEDISVREVERRLKEQRDSLHPSGDVPSSGGSRAPLGLQKSVAGSVELNVGRVQ